MAFQHFTYCETVVISCSSETENSSTTQHAQNKPYLSLSALEFLYRTHQFWTDFQQCLYLIMSVITLKHWLVVAVVGNRLLSELSLVIKHFKMSGDTINLIHRCMCFWPLMLSMLINSMLLVIMHQSYQETLNAGICSPSPSWLTHLTVIRS